MTDAIINSFANFLSWGVRPKHVRDPRREALPVPPAVWAYLLGFTWYCPPKGEL